MDLYILDREFRVISVIDSFSSLIWCRRYAECGEFELYLPATTKNMIAIQPGNFVSRKDDPTTYLIEYISISTDEESGDYITAKGRDLKCILGQRIVWTQTTVSGTVEACIRKLVTDNVISPILIDRKIPGFSLSSLNGMSDQMEMQITGDNLLEKIAEICKSYGYGFDVVRSGAEMIFEVFQGKNRSRAQSELPRVVFSPGFDNLITSSYEYNQTGYKNVVLVAGEGEGTARKTVVYGSGEGINRYELYDDSRNVSTNDGEVSTDEYNTLLQEQGKAALSEHTLEESFACTIEMTRNYIYKKDFDIGDIVTIENEYGIGQNARIAAVTESWSEAGEYAIDPTLEGINA